MKRRTRPGITRSMKPIEMRIAMRRKRTKDAPNLWKPSKMSPTAMVSP